MRSGKPYKVRDFFSRCFASKSLLSPVVRTAPFCPDSTSGILKHMKHKKVATAIAAVVVVVVAIGIVVVFRANSAPSAPQTVSGRVTSISNQCQTDGVCSVTLDGSTVIVTGCGLLANGKTCKTFDQSTLRVGQQVQATVIKGKSGQYSLDCSSCTIGSGNN